MRLISFFLFIPLGGCTTFGDLYTYYGLNVEEQKLMARESQGGSQKDQPISVCAADEVQKGKCIVVKSDEFFKIESDYNRLLKKLESCQKSQSN